MSLQKLIDIRERLSKLTQTSAENGTDASPQAQYLVSAATAPLEAR